jgi:hypothetical protein
VALLTYRDSLAKNDVCVEPRVIADHSTSANHCIWTDRNSAADLRTAANASGRVNAGRRARRAVQAREDLQHSFLRLGHDYSRGYFSRRVSQLRRNEYDRHPIAPFGKQTRITRRAKKRDVAGSGPVDRGYSSNDCSRVTAQLTANKGRNVGSGESVGTLTAASRTVRRFAAH